MGSCGTVFQMLDAKSNDSLLDLNNRDRYEFMSRLGRYDLEFRDVLGIDKDITFGLEMEFENANRVCIEFGLSKMFSDGSWVVVNDGSLYNGGEINSPKMTDTKANWIELSKVCSLVSANAYVLDNTSAHVHIGMHILGNNPKYWGNFIKLWMAYENVIFRFLYGEYLSPRNFILEQARPISLDLIDKYESGRLDDRMNKGTAYYMFQLLDAGSDFRERRKRAINFTNVSSLEPYKYNTVGDMRTIEFRSPNGTFDPVIWQNNVNLLVHLFMYAKSDKFDLDKVTKRIKYMKEEEVASNIYKYSRIYNEQAIELCDMIFDNNLDKIYFLRQYIKDGKVSSKSLTKSNSFTKKKFK